MAQSKATKKFEKRHLKDTLERRKGLKKVKQKQQLKARKKARKAEEDGVTPNQSSEAVPQGKETSVKDKFQDMSVDDFFQGGFEIPELPKQKLGKSGAGKRKRDSQPAASDSDDNGDSASLSDGSHDGVDATNGNGHLSDSESDMDDFADHQEQLDALAQNDPDFHKYLQENEPELLDAARGDIGELSEEEDDAQPERKRQKKGSLDEDDLSDDAHDGDKNELDLATVRKWEKALVEQHSLRATKEVVIAFRSAAHVSDDNETSFKYSISDPDVYHQLLTTALEHVPAVFEHHLPVQSSKGGKVHVATESKKFKTLTPLLRSQIASTIHLLDHLSDPATIRLTLTSTLPLLPYLLSFKKVVRDVCRAVTAVWSSSSNTEATRIAAFLVLRRLVVIGDTGIRENVLKSTYQGLVKGARSTTTHTIAGVNLMKNSAAELWGLVASSVAYTTSFTFIRQLAIHLRGSITNNSNESYKTVYNWQYVHSLDFWSRVLSSHAVDAASPLRPLIYPLVQVTMGALRLIPTATYFPLRFQLIRSLLRLSLATDTYIPLAPALFEVLNSAEMRKPPKASTVKPLDFATSIRAGKSYLRTRIYQDGIGEQVTELLSEFFVLWAKNIAFPELALPVIVMLRRWLKDANSRTPGAGNRNHKVNGMVGLLVQKLEANAKFIEQRRAKVDFAPRDRQQVDRFLADLDWSKTPLGAFVVGQRATRVERARVIEEGRKEEERRHAEDKAKGRAAGSGVHGADGFEASVDESGEDDDEQDLDSGDDEDDAVDGDGDVSLDSDASDEE